MPYSIDDPIVEIEDYASIICRKLKKNIKKYSIDNVKLIIEPGRAIVARSGVAIYTIGGIKEIPNLRKYVLLTVEWRIILDLPYMDLSIVYFL